MNLEIINQAEKRVPRQFLDWWLRELTSRLAPRISLKNKAKIKRMQTLYLVFLPLSEARKLNKRFRGKNHATDILSFAAVEPGSFGELVVCPQVITKQAKEHGLTYQFELGYMLTHGVLHLLGYEHENGGVKERKMFALQDDVFDRLCQKWQRQ